MAMKPKKNNTGPVYSTDRGRLCPQCLRAAADCVCGKARPVNTGDGVARIRRETKGRGGKAVTVIEGLPLAPDALKVVAKKLKQTCGVGGALKDAVIEIQGDQRENCKKALEAMGHPCKLAGG